MTKSINNNIMKVVPLFLLVFFLQMQTCNFEEFLPENSVLLNQTMIPVWAALKLKDYDKAKQSSHEIQYRFNQLLGDAPAYQETWIEFVQADLNLLVYSIDEGDMELATELAYCVMDELHEWHSINERAYYFDKIWDFEQSHRQLVEVLNDDYLKMFEWKEVENLIEELNTTWNIILKTPVDLRGYYFLESPQLLDFLETKTEINLCVQEFNSQVEDADCGYLAQICNELEPNLIQLIKVFGYDPQPTEPTVANF